MRLRLLTTTLTAVAVAVGVGITPIPPTYPDLPRDITDINARAAIIRLEREHGGISWAQRQAVQFTIEETMNGEKPVSHTVLLERETGRVRMETTDGDVVIFDGKAMWSSSEDAADAESVRQAWTWPFLLMAPLRLRESGLEVASAEARAIGQKRYPTIKATFNETPGSAACKWFLIFEDSSQRHASAVAFEVADGNGDRATRMVQFKEFDTVDGIKHPAKWTFLNWSEADGVSGESIGEATITDVSFPVPEEDAFKPSEDAVKIDGDS